MFALSPLDEVFEECSSNPTVFERSVKNIVDSCVEGFNGMDENWWEICRYKMCSLLWV